MSEKGKWPALSQFNGTGRVMKKHTTFCHLGENIHIVLSLSLTWISLALGKVSEDASERGISWLFSETDKRGLLLSLYPACSLAGQALPQ